jgi:hypothetical protein
MSTLRSINVNEHSVLQIDQIVQAISDCTRLLAFAVQAKTESVGEITAAVLRSILADHRRGQPAATPASGVRFYGYRDHSLPRNFSARMLRLKFLKRNRFREIGVWRRFSKPATPRRVTRFAQRYVFER